MNNFFCLLFYVFLDNIKSKSYLELTNVGVIVAGATRLVSHAPNLSSSLQDPDANLPVVGVSPRMPK